MTQLCSFFKISAFNNYVYYNPFEVVQNEVTVKSANNCDSKMAYFVLTGTQTLS